ncbi:MAG: hypothetical protein GY938_24390 [Ketobacter sp.]|nr:hypothetical protein [Ketobacter sp.]
MNIEDMEAIAELLNSMMNVFIEKNCLKKLAEFNHLYYMDLVNAGFSKEDAMRIIVANPPLPKSQS